MLQRFLVFFTFLGLQSNSYLADQSNLERCALSTKQMAISQKMRSRVNDLYRQTALRAAGNEV